MENKFYVIFIFILFCIYLPPTQLAGKNKYTVKVIQPDPIQAPVFTSVTVSAENKNHLEWEQTTNENIRYFKIYRLAANPEDGWIQLSKVMFPGDYSFTDATSYPNVRSYQYRISTVDKCGNEIFAKQIHKTIKLSVETINNTSYLLKWNPYEGFIVAGYKIYRGLSASNLTPIDTTLATVTSYTDINNSLKDVFYQVEAIAKQDTIPATKKASLSACKTRSNIVSNRTFLTFSDTVDASKIYLYPNPLVISAVVVFPYESSETYILTILDISGQTVYTKQVFSGEIEIERKNLKEGLYILQIAGKKIYRKKLMVGRGKV